MNTRSSGYSMYLIMLVSALILFTFTNIPVNAYSELDKITNNIVINPFTILKGYLSHSQEPAPVGIGAYGFYYDKGLQPLVINTTKELAIVKINSLSAYNPTLSHYPHGASLQLNVMMEVKTIRGTTIIWLQDVVGFDNTATNQLNVIDNIWNVATKEANIVAHGKGGYISASGQQVYVYSGPEQQYSLPLTLRLGIAIKPVTEGVMVDFYDKPFGRGTFDEVLIPFSNVVSAKLVVAPSHLRSNTASMDSELIWGGDCCGSSTTFSSMDSDLAIYYENSTGKYEPFPALFTFGTETAETARNLVVEKSAHGGHVVIGRNHNHFLEQLKSLTPAPADNEFIQLRQELEAAKNQTTDSSQDNTSNTSIPSWVRNNANWWSQGSLNDADFIKGIQYLVQQGIIQIPQTQSSSSSGSQQIPQWVKNTAGWWANGQVSDDEFVKAVQFMISSGIITIQ